MINTDASDKINVIFKLFNVYTFRKLQDIDNDLLNVHIVAA